MKTLPAPLQPQRSAHPSIRGYLYQCCLTALRWLHLDRNEIIVFEGDEDIDRFILHRNLAIYEQTKDLTDPVDVRHESVRKTLKNFLVNYTALRLQDKESRFIFTTTARFRRRLSTSGVDVLADWHNQEIRPAVVAEVRSLLLTSNEKKGPARRPQKRSEVPGLPAAIEWLDAAPGRWDGFFDAVDWHPEAPSHNAILHQIEDDLSCRSDTRDLASDLTFRLVMEVLLASSDAERVKRSRDQKALEVFILSVQKELAGWRASPAAANMRAIFDETFELGRILKDPSLDPNPDRVRRSPGKLLPAYYEVVPFDVESRQTEMKSLEDWCGGSNDRSVWLLHGDGGTGKTRLMLEWCQRLEHHGWHAGFLDTDTAYASPEVAQPLLSGVAPRLIVIDYAEQHPEAARRLIKQLSLRQSGPKIRLVLLTRRVPDWWEKLGDKSDALDDLLAPEVSPKPLHLQPLFSQSSAREKALTKAVRTFSDALGEDPPTSINAKDLMSSMFNNALFLYMKALSIVYKDAPERQHDILRTILVHERRYWQKEIEASNLKVYEREALEDAIDKVIAAITLLGEVSMAGDEAQTLIELVTGGTLKALDLDHAFLRILRRLCGNNNNSLASLQPDPLGEQLIESVVQEQTGARASSFLTQIFEGAQDTKALRRLIETTLRLLQRRGTTPVEPIAGGDRLESGMQWLEAERAIPKE